MNWMAVAVASLCWLAPGLQAASAPIEPQVASSSSTPNELARLNAHTEDARASTAKFREMIESAPALRASLEKEQADEQQRLVEQGPSGATVVVPPNPSLADAESSLVEARAKAQVAADAVTALEEESARRTSRQEQLPAEIAQAEEAVKLARERKDTAPADATTPERMAELAAEVVRAEAFLEAASAEQDAYAALGDVVPLQRDAAVRRRKTAEAAVAAWQEAYKAASQRDAEATKKAAEAQFNDTVKRYPTLQKIASQNFELAALRSGPKGLPMQISAANESVLEAEALLAETLRRRRLAARRNRTGALTEGMAAKLRRDFEWLPSRADLAAEDASLDRRLTEAEIREINLEEDLVLDPEARVQELIDQRMKEGEKAPEAGWTEAALKLLRQQRDMQTAALEEVSQLEKRLYSARTLRGQVREAVEEYRAFIEARIVWVRSAPLNPLSMIRTAPEDALDIASEMAKAFQAVEDEDDGSSLPPLTAVLALIGSLILLASKRFLGGKLRAMSDSTRSYKSDRYLLTLRALVQTVLLAAPLPMMMWAIGRWLGADHQPALLRSAGSALREVTWLYGVMRFLVVLLRSGGVGISHFRWRVDSAEHVRRHLRWYEPILVVLAFAALALDRHGVQAWSDSIGRLAFIAWTLVTALFVKWAIGAQSPIWEPKKGDDDAGFLLRTKRLWLILAISMPVGLSILALTGYYYTALQFELRIRTSGYFLLALLVVYSMLLRWLYISRRKLAVTQALEARERRKKATETSADGSQAPALDLDHVDIPSVDAQTRQLFKSSMTLTSVLGIYLIWTSALPALQQLNRVQLLPRLAIISDESASLNPDSFTNVPLASAPSGAPSPSPAGSSARVASGQASKNSAEAPTSGEGQKDTASESGSEASGPSATAGLPGMPTSQKESAKDSEAPPILLNTLTLGDVLLALIFLALTNVAVRNLPALLELALLQRLPLDGGARYAITTIVRYLILIVGVSAISGAVGIGWRQVQWLAAALTFGLAFGLQEIFANFVSGLIILIERPVRVGDIVTVGGTEGRVTQLRMRATTILDWDRREYLIPNKEFITASVINWTLTDPVTRVVIAVGVAYGSDTDLARKLLIEAAKECRQVMDDPVPSAIFRRFGDSTLDFDLRVYLANRDLWPTVIDELHSKIDKKFRSNGIEIAFPQRDVHVSGAIHLERQGGSKKEAQGPGSEETQG
ncbi:mechanosensitive ion channel domain-containing protein [Planctomycetes bacterium Poly30]